jgi:CrcB protein
MSPLAWTAFVVAGAVGTPARYLLEGAITERVDSRFPWGTFVVNVTGSLVLGLLTGLGLTHGFPKIPRVALGAGFCGAYTTFSTFTYESVRLLEEGAVGESLRNSAGTLLAGLAAAAAGLAVAAL